METSSLGHNYMSVVTVHPDALYWDGHCKSLGIAQLIMWTWISSGNCLFLGMANWDSLFSGRQTNSLLSKLVLTFTFLTQKCFGKFLILLKWLIRVFSGKKKCNCEVKLISLLPKPTTKQKNETEMRKYKYFELGEMMLCTFFPLFPFGLLIQKFDEVFCSPHYERGYLFLSFMIF